MIMRLLYRLFDKVVKEVRRTALQIRRIRVPAKLRRIPSLPVSSKENPTVLFYSTDAGIKPHFSQHCIMAKSLQACGQRVAITRCVKLFEKCPVLAGERFTPDTPAKKIQKKCIECCQNSIESLESYGLDVVDLRRFLTPAMEAIYKDATKDLESKSLINFEFDGLKFGSLCTGDMALVYKIRDFNNVTDLNQKAWATYVRDAVLSYLLLDACVQEMNVQSIVYSSEYSLMLAAQFVGKKHNIPVFCSVRPCHLNVDHRRAIIYEGLGCFRHSNVLSYWEHWKKLPLDADRIQELGDDLLMRLDARGWYCYSPSKTLGSGDLREELGLSKDRKLLVAYTSSIDEVNAQLAMSEALGKPTSPEPQPFVDQIAWLRSLVDYVASSNDLQLVVRIHPREGANQREKAQSQHLAALRKAFAGELPNCVFVWPEDTVSSYDLAELADVALISWSSIGVELARLGIPVLASFNLPEVAYPLDSFLHWAPFSAAYFYKLEDLLSQPPSLESVVQAGRWYNLCFIESSLDFSDIVRDPQFSGLPKYNHPAMESGLLKEVVVGGKPLLDLRSREDRSHHNDEKQAEEEMAVRIQLCRLVHFVCTGEKYETDSIRDIEIVDEASMEAGWNPEDNPSLATKNYLVLKGNSIVYRTGQKRFERYSPMLSRLATMIHRHSKSVTRMNSG